MGRISFAQVDDSNGGVRRGRSSRTFVARVVPAVGVVVAVLAAGCGGSDDQSPKARAASQATRAPSEPAGAANIELPGGRIAFRRYFDDAHSHGAIFTINPDGSHERQLTDPPKGTVDDGPDWSPDGKRIVFQRCPDAEPCRVYTVAAGGGPLTEVKARCELRPTCELLAPAWTPGGRLLVSLGQGRLRPDASTGEKWYAQSSIELLDLDNGTQRTLVKRRGFTGNTDAPAISPDGRTVIYTRENSDRSKPVYGDTIFMVDIDGSHHRRLTPWKLGGGDHPGFAPDGTILFRSYEEEEGKQADYWTVRADGTHLRRMTHYTDGTIVLSASHSSDGEWIAHATNGVDAYADVFVMRADGTGNLPVTRSKLWDSGPDWGPAGS